MEKEKLFDTMSAIVDDVVKSYKSDFDLDKKSIDSWNGKWWAVWVVREHGTQLQRFTNALDPLGYIEAVNDSMNVHSMYLVKFNRREYSIEPITLEEIRKMAREMNRFRIEVYATDCYTGEQYDGVGCFDTIKEANESGERLMKKLGGRTCRVTEMKSRY